VDTLAYLRSRRMWAVSGLKVWGSANDVEMFYLGAENDGDTNSIFFGRSSLSTSIQDISFSELSDWRGIPLPEMIASPRIIVSPRSEYNAFLIGDQSDTGFRIARDADAPGPITVDLFIFEMEN